MKKLTKLHFILIALLVAAIAAAAFFSFSYRSAQAKQPDIRAEVNQALMQLEIIKQENDPTPLQEELDNLRSELFALTPETPLFPERPRTVEIGDLIVDTVNKFGTSGTASVSLLKLSPNDEAGTVTIETGEEAEGNKYNKAEYEIKVEGDLGRIVSLIGEVEGAGFTTLTIEDIELTYEEEEDENEKVFKFWVGEFTIVTLYEYEDEE